MNTKKTIIIIIAISCLLSGAYFTITGVKTLTDKERTRYFSLDLINDVDIHIKIKAHTNDYLFSEIEPITTTVYIEPESELEVPIDFEIFINIGYGDTERILYTFRLLQVHEKKVHIVEKTLDITIDESKDYWMWYSVKFNHPPSANDPNYISSFDEKIKIHTESTALQTRLSYEQRALTYGILSLGLYTLTAMLVSLYYNKNIEDIKKKNTREKMKINFFLIKNKTSLSFLAIALLVFVIFTFSSGLIGQTGRLFIFLMYPIFLSAGITILGINFVRELVKIKRFEYLKIKFLKKKPKIFEFLFFIFLFGGTSCVSFSTVYFGKSENIGDFLYQMWWIGIFYGLSLATGWLHYIEKLDE
ncbi:MAG: hypothetical protein KAW45_02230 [Thermoplasmatales archaeon]|nr:hypothetical protein [Thermoplasmatales archaeon]